MEQCNLIASINPLSWFWSPVHHPELNCRGESQQSTRSVDWQLCKSSSWAIWAGQQVQGWEFKQPCRCLLDRLYNSFHKKSHCFSPQLLHNYWFCLELRQMDGMKQFATASATCRWGVNLWRRMREILRTSCNETPALVGSNFKHETQRLWTCGMQNLYCLLDFTEDVLHPTSVEIWESTWTMLQVPNPLRPKTSQPKESPGTQKQRRDKIWESTLEIDRLQDYTDGTEKMCSLLHPKVHHGRYDTGPSRLSCDGNQCSARSLQMT